MLDYDIQAHYTVTCYYNNDSIYVALCYCLRAFVDSIYVRL